MNVEVFTGKSLAALLPKILPEAWAGKKIAELNQDGNSKHGVEVRDSSVPSTEWMSMLWKYLLSLRSLNLFVRRWPLLPVEGGWVVQIPEGLQDANVLAYEEGLATCIPSLQAMDCFVLLASLKGEADSPLLRRHIQPKTLQGILSAIALSRNLSLTDSAEISSAFARKLRKRIRLEDRQRLRSYLLQNCWFLRGQHRLLPENILTLKALPIFERFGADDEIHAYCQDHDPMLTDANEVTADYVSLLSNEYGTSVVSEDCWCLPPRSMYSETTQLLHGNAQPEVLRENKATSDNTFLIRASSDEEETILRKELSIRSLSKAEFYIEFVIDRVSTMQADLRDRLMIQLLRELPSMCSDNAGSSTSQSTARKLKELLSSVPFVPIGSGNRSHDETENITANKLAAPEDLYDPRVPELVSHHDPEVRHSFRTLPALYSCLKTRSSRDEV